MRMCQSEGVIMSPNYPEEYDQGIDCEWLIQLVPGHVVQLKFAQSHEYPFNIDGHGTYCNESAYADDYVALYNGPTTDNPLAPDSRNEQLSPFHCGLYDEDPDFKLPGFKSTESSGKGSELTVLFISSVTWLDFRARSGVWGLPIKFW